MSLTYGGRLGVEVVEVDAFAGDDSYIVYRSDCVGVQVIADADTRVR